ncbi:MAG: glycosyltransferase [Natronospirillum sp.]
MLNDNELEITGQVRREIGDLCGKGEFLSAYLRLKQSGLQPDTNPGPWEFLAQRCEEAKLSELAHNLRRRLWEAGIRTGDIALREAERALQSGMPEYAAYFLGEVFGDTPTEGEPRILLASALTESAPDRAHALLRDIEVDEADAALVVLDRMRDIGEFSAAEEKFQIYDARFPEDVRILQRGARIFQSQNNWAAALSIWKRVHEFGDPHRVRALLEMARIEARFERQDRVRALVAEYFLADPPIHEAIDFAFEMGQPNFGMAQLQDAVWFQGKSGRSTAQWSRIATGLIDRGELGIVAWLYQQGVDVGPQVIALIGKAFDEGLIKIAGRTPLAIAARLKGPDILLPLEKFFRFPPVPRNGVRTTGGKVLLVNSTLSAGGAERQLVTLARALIAQGVAPRDLHVALFSCVPDRGHAHFLPALDALGVHIHRIDQRRWPFGQFPENLKVPLALLPTPLRNDAAALWQLVAELRPDAIHGWQDRSALAAGLVGALQGISHIVLSARNMSPPKRGDPRLNQTRGLYLAMAKHANVTMTANSSNGARDYEEWLGLPNGAISVLNNGLDVATLAAPRSMPKVHPTKGKIRIGGVFRFAANKRPDLWMHTLAGLREILGREVQPVLIGTGPYLADILKLRDTLGFDDMEFHQALSEPEEIYSKFDALLLMSRVEGTPNVLLEAQAFGLPVAACDVGGVRDAMLGSGKAHGLLLPADVTALSASETIARWLPKALEAKADARRAFVAQQFSTERLGKSVLDWYGQEAAQ